MASQNSSRDQFSPSFNEEFEPAQQTEYNQQASFIPVSEVTDGMEYQPSQQMMTQNQFLPQDNPEEPQVVTQPPPEIPLPEELERIEEDEVKLEANFGFSSTHGVTYGHGPRRSNGGIMGRPPPPVNLQSDRTNFHSPPTMSTPQHENFQQQPRYGQPPEPSTPPMMMNQPPMMTNQPPMMTNQPPMMTNQPPMMTNQPPMMTADVSSPEINNRPPVVTEHHQQEGHQHHQPPPSQYNQPPSQPGYEAGRQSSSYDDNTAKPSHLPYPHHRKFNEEIPPPNTSSQFLIAQRTIPELNIENTQCSSAFMRSTIRSSPNTPGLLKKFGLPFGVLMHPFVRGMEVPLVNLGFTEIIRCYSCRCYVNPFCKFVDRGYKWKCNLCKTMNDVPKCYYSKLNESGIREDLASHPELTNGSVEFVAPKRYHTSLTGHATCFIFMIDVSRRSIESGSLREICEMLLERLDDLPSGPRTKVALITFNKQLHFYSLRGKQPRMFVIGELEESLLPLPKDILVSLSDGRACLKTLLKMLPKKLFPQQKQKVLNPLDAYPMENAMFSALRSAHRLISRSGGKLLIFLSAMPTVGRDKLSDRSSLPIPQQLEPSKLRYKTMALDFSKKAISVDLFTLSFEDEGSMGFSGQPFDLGTMMALPKYTSGNHYPCPSLLSVRDGLRRSISSITGFDAVMRVRVSTGLKISNFYGNFFIKGHDLLALPYCDDQKGYGVELVHGGSFISTPNSAIQCAVLYTLPSGERRIRVHNLVLPVTSQLTDIYSHCDIYAQMDLLGKQIVDDLHRVGFEAQRQKLLDRVVTCIKTYRRDVKLQDRSYDQLVLADSIRLLPLYTLCLLKHACLGVTAAYVDKNIGSTDASQPKRKEFYPLVFNADARMRGIQAVSSACVRDCILHIHPEVYQIDQDNTGVENLLVPLTRKRIRENHMYLVNDGTSLKAWMTGSNVNQAFLDVVQKKIDELNGSLFPASKRKKKNKKKQKEIDGEDEDDDDDSEEEEEEEEETDDDEEENENKLEQEEEVKDSEKEHPVIQGFADLVAFQRRKYSHRAFVVELVTPEMASKHQRLVMKLVNDASVDQKSGRVTMFHNSYERFIVDLHDAVIRN